MRLLIDTHVLIWWWEDDSKLGRRREVLADRSNDIWVSAVSAWEIANKVRRGQLPTMASRLSEYCLAVIDDGFSHLPIHEGHALAAGMLAGEHRDPFDRLLAAQSLQERMVMMTRDPEFLRFGCEVLW